MKQDATALITQQFIDAIESGMVEGSWVRPWALNASTGFPSNALTGKAYSGTNALVLLMTGGGEFATYKQWQEKGAQVMKGSKSIKILRPLIKKDLQKDKDSLIGFTTASVFSASQVEGYQAPSFEPKAFNDSLEAESFISASGASIRHNQEGRAYYVPSLDAITMPHKVVFDTEQDYYSTLLHELSHWTGHKSRLDRDLNTGRFGDEAYAFEELVAELASTFLCAHLGIHQGYQDNHAKYLKGWLKVLKNDTKAIMTAASQADKAFKHLCEYSAAVASKAA